MAKKISKIESKRIVKKVSKKNFSTKQGHGLRVESMLRKMIEDGQTSSIKGNATALERTIGASACKRLADFLEDCLEGQRDGVGGIC